MFPLIFEAIGWFIINSSDRYFIGHYSGLSEVAIYSLGYKLASILLILVVMPFDMVYGPFIFSHMKDLKIKKYIATYFTYLVLLLGLGSVIILLFSRDLIRIAAPSQYAGSLKVLMVILPVIAMNGIYYWSAALLHIVRKTYIIGLTMIVAAILSLLLNYVLVPHYGWMGAAISINVTFMLAVIAIFSVGMRDYYVPLEIKRLVIACGTFISIIAIFIVIRKFPPFSYYSSVIILFCAIPLIFKMFNFVNEDEKAHISNLLSKFFNNT